jgi:hypothetical protein
MRKVASVSFIVLAVLLVIAEPSSGQRRRPSPRGRPPGRVLVNVGPFWGRPQPWPYVVYAPPPVIVQPSPIFVQQQPQVIVQQPPPVIVQQPSSPAPPQESSAAESHEYWYFCPSARAYYPTVSDCPDPWIRVPPRPA